jgi:hypothetical protein
MSSMAWGLSHPVAPVGSHSLPSVPMRGQLHGAALLSRTAAACPHALQVMMTPPVRMSCRRLSNVRACFGNMQA